MLRQMNKQKEPKLKNTIELNSDRTTTVLRGANYNRNSFS